jgi:ubiquinol-cytochrome c reductase iron-sulfur subunit
MNELEHPTGDPYGAKDGKDLISGITVFPMEPHVPRKADIDPKAAIRAERQVATMFGLSSLMIILFVIAYSKVPADLLITIPVIGTLNANHLAIGFTFGMAILLIGLGAIHWAKKLMPDEEVIQERHALTSSNEDRAAVQSSLARGAAESGFKDRKIIRRSLLGALALFPVPLIVLLRDLGPMPGTRLRETIWDKGIHLVTDATYRKIKASDIPLGGLINAVPENLLEIEHEEENLNQRGKASIIIVRMDPADIVSQQGDTWDYQGILAFSKICTHLGCPTSLYQQRTHHLLCPCHQSTFDLSDSGNVVFGPSARRMPQLAITVDAEGYLIAQSGFNEPVGPSFWERG